MGKKEKKGRERRKIDDKRIKLYKDYGEEGEGVKVDEEKGRRNYGGWGYWRDVWERFDGLEKNDGWR